jgi:hypothetical protein
MIRTIAISCFALLAVGCAMGESVNDDQSAFAAAGAAAGAGGAESTAGAAGESSGGEAGAPDDGPGASPIVSGGGGAAGAGDDPGGGEAGAPPMCQSGEKLCESGCVELTPEVGCGSYGCTPCNTPPANSKATCNGALCDFECLPGFTQNGFACVPTGGTGGSGGSGSGGSGGSGGSSSGSGGTGGSPSMCVAPCNPSDSTSQFLCVAACVSKGGLGLCAPALNCCVCG